MFVLTATPSYAYGIIRPDYSTMNSFELAYCDIVSAPESWKNKILAARNEIIYSKSWTVDGQVSVIYPNGTKYTAPEFSDLFPGWDIPIDQNCMPIQNKANIASSMGADFYGNVYLNTPSQTVATPSFYMFLTNSSYVTMVALSIPGTTWNGGFTNIDTGENIGFYRDMSAGSAVYLYNTNAATIYGARASTYSTQGYALMSVYDN